MLTRIAAVLLFTSATLAQTAQPDWKPMQEEMLKFTKDLIRIDTSNPPGNETKAAQYIKDVLDREGIASNIYESAPGRGNLVARLRGSGKKKPILIMGHLDVVGVERDKWTTDPFTPVIKDGFLYGRGSADDKDIVAGVLETFLTLKRRNVALDRDVIFVAEAGEEGTSQYGIDFLVANHWDEISAEFAYTEGPNPVIAGGKLQWVGVGTSEKVPRGVKLTAKGTSGHASMPKIDDPVTHLAAAVAKIGNWRTPMRQNDTTRAFFAGLAKISPPEWAQVYTHLEDPKSEDRLLAQHPEYYAMIHTTLVPTIINGGFRENVIPGSAEAVVDIRALPDEDVDALYTEMKKLINDPLVTFASNQVILRPANPPSSTDTEFYRALAKAAAEVYGNVPVLPLQAPYTTDMAQLRKKGVQAYGFGPAADVERGPQFHGNDERISIAEMGRYLRWLYTAMEQTAKQGD
jgi:acetylornithine deacetylase/succinyl-diaminopimelate desuccinylase-like protein